MRRGRIDITEEMLACLVIERLVGRINDDRTAYRVFIERQGIALPEAEASAMSE